MKTIQNELGGNPVEKEMKSTEKKPEQKNGMMMSKRYSIRNSINCIVSTLLLLSILFR